MWYCVAYGVKHKTLDLSTAILNCEHSLFSLSSQGLVGRERTNKKSALSCVCLLCCPAAIPEGLVVLPRFISLRFECLPFFRANLILFRWQIYFVNLVDETNFFC